MQFKMNENGFEHKTSFGTLEVSGNEEFGFRPYQLLVSSIAVCSGGVLRKVLQKKRISFSDIELTADVTRNEAGVNEVTDVALHFTIIGTDASRQTIAKALSLATKNCPIVQSVNKSIRITEDFTLRNEVVDSKTCL
ncbi:OsmC family protein [Alkalicoccobacillus plakortidis]|uniref:OsmC family protein n=1 Tax=Alkalicoccobacillus plakortidis TaxID=444060 RepID=A0ABT0XH78_9BACI|nr:OsmC family protein [Alkalicoccobacillus plakortidis]MCM2675248.1 OsmC family protein [Alkalicoccobacillus plakortidis]